MPEIPNAHAAVAMLITLVALALFSRERIPLETSSLVILVLLVVFFEIFPFVEGGEQLEATSLFSGFGHEALVAVAGLMVCGQGLVATGALIPVGRWIARLWKRLPALSILITLAAGALGSAFVNNTPIVVLLIPILTAVAARNNASASPWLMPMNFSTLLGGTCTTIGTSTNLLVVAVAADLGLKRFGMFDFVVPGLIAGLAGILYLWLIAPRLLDAQHQSGASSKGREFLFQMDLLDESKISGKTLGDINSKTDGEISILRLQRSGESGSLSSIAPLPDIEIIVGDRLIGCGEPDTIKELEAMLGGQLIQSPAGFYDSTAENEAPGQDEELAQIVVMENSALIGRSLVESHFAKAFNIDVLAIHRANQSIRSMAPLASDFRVRSGDILLVQGKEDDIDEIKNVRSLLVLDERKALPDIGRGWLAISILAAVVAAAALGVLSIASSAMCGAVAMLGTRCISWRDVADALSIPVIMIVVVSLAMGSALTQTGATAYMAEMFLYTLADSSAMVVLGALIALMAILTNIVSNNAAAVIGTPIAISVANQLGAPPETFVLGVLFGANLSFVTPMAYKTNVLVMSAGDYRFTDFVRVGLPLALILLVLYTFLLPALYGL